MMSPMIRPLRAGEAFLADVRAHASGLGLWWLGQSGFLVAWQGRHLLLDPYLSDSLTRKYADTDKPHKRMTERVVDPAALGFVDVVCASHAHTDHLDPDTLRALVAARPDVVLVAPAAHRELATERAGIAPLGIAGNLDGEEAAALAHEIGAGVAVPMHFEMFAFNTEPPDAFVAACERLGQPYRVLRAGERLLRPR